MMNFNNLTVIADAGFEGFETFSFLRQSKLSDVPEEPGVYMVVRNHSELPKFLQKSRAGPYKGNCSSLTARDLEQAWIPNVLVLYVGKAGGAGIAQGLRGRLSKFVRTGFSKNAARRGGTLIWQVEGCTDFQVCWKSVLDREPKDVETELIESFVTQHAKKPFANR